jgi:crotonobetaine/carnitine-CoA ligase
MFGEVFNRFDLRDRTMTNVLVDAAQRHGDRPFAHLPGGSLRFDELPGVAARAAGALRSLGVGRGDTVAVVMGNRVEYPAVLWGQAWQGGIGVPINAEHRTSTLQYQLAHSEASVIVTQASKLENLERIAGGLDALRAVIVVGDEEYPTWPGPEFVRWDDLLRAADPLPRADVAFSDPYLIMYTSGTTGPSKGVVMSHHHHYCYSAPLVDLLSFTPADHLYTPLPLFHTAAHNTMLLPALFAGAQVTIRERFSASAFWGDVGQCGATFVLLIGAMGNILLRRPSLPDERSHQVKALWCVPPPEDEFAERFGVDVLWQGWGMTEAYPNQMRYVHAPGKPRNCIGRTTELFDLKVVDEDDIEVPRDGATIGEIVVRPNLPYAMMTEYFKNPEATAQATRNLWFHTGDHAAMDADGFLLFHGRKKDAIRRRGENISAHELELEVMSHPAVKQAAAYGVPAELGEEDVKIDVVLMEGRELTAAELVAHLRARVPGFMLPRYVQFRDEFPLTASQRVEKYRLKAEGTAGAHYDAGDRRVSA